MDNIQEEKKPLKICLLSDLDFRFSGYFNIAISLGSGLALRGHQIKTVGLGYAGEEHDFPFSIIPCRNFNEAVAMIQNLLMMWKFEILVIAMDIPVQERFLDLLRKQGLNLPYVGIMPIEADPLCMTWALNLMQMDKALVISKFGTEEAKRVGVEADYLPVGINPDAWRFPTSEERTALRNALGFKPEDYIVLTVAYNQERKFLSRSLEIFTEFNKQVPNSKYVMVTAEHSDVGWRLQDLAQEFGIGSNLIIVERGMSQNRLWGIYAASDVFMLTSKAEGMGLPILEAMATGIPCLGTDCTGIKELLSDGRGRLIPYDYTIRDPFGNGRRYYASISEGARLLLETYNSDNIEMIRKAKDFANTRDWAIAVDVVENALYNVLEKRAQANVEKS